MIYTIQGVDEAEASEDLAVMQSWDMKTWPMLRRFKLSGAASALWVMVICM